MKTQLLRLSIIGFSLVSLFACEKQEPLHPDPSKIISLAVTGNTTEDLEFVYKDSVIATGLASNSAQFVFNIKLNIGSAKAELKIRKKASGLILNTMTIPPTPFNQALNVFYDGSKLFNTSVIYVIKGFAASGELEFLLDGKIVATGTGKINKTVVFGIDENTPREITVRKKGETNTLLTKTINALPAQQSLIFFYDGTGIATNIQLDPPVNPSHMAVTAQFKTTIPDKFLGGPVDLVFYIHNNKTDTYTKPSPELRFTMLAEGFTSFELPALPNATDYDYRPVIFKKGTNDMPYDSSNLAFPFMVNDGSFSSQINFESGISKIWLIEDFEGLVVSPTFEIFSSFGAQTTDLSQYFN